jgi:hypothetical protein
METEMVRQHTTGIQQSAVEYVVVEPGAAEYIVRESRVEEDGVDWCAWWAEYAEMME